MFSVQSILTIHIKRFTWHHGLKNYNNQLSICWIFLRKRRYICIICVFIMSTVRQHRYPDSKVHGANMGPIWVLSAPDGPHIGPMNLAIRVVAIYMTVCMTTWPCVENHARGPFYQHGLTLIPAWICNYMPSKVWDEITYPFLNFKVISSHTLWWMY